MSEDTTTPEGGSTTTTSTGPTGAADKTFTQADVDRIVAERLRRERERFADYDALKAKAAEADASKSDLQKLTDRVEAAERRAAEAEAKQLRTEIAQAKGLTAAQAKRLTGSTKEELEADADDLLEAFGNGGGQKADAKPEDASTTEPEDAPLFGRPKERLTSGAAPNSEPEKSGSELADEVLKKARGF